MKEFWDELYSASAYAYGKNPNSYFKSCLDKLSSGSLLLAAEGEGRNAVYAAEKQWKISAYDWSEIARDKALKLAKEKQVHLDYHLGSLKDLNFEANSFDALGLIYVHFPEGIRQLNHGKLLNYIKPGGHLIMEAFHEDHLEYQRQNPAVGGPKMLQQLYTAEKIQSDFVDLDFHYLEEVEITLEEGFMHNGTTKVVRALAQKPF